jgi:hypothetical protein
MREQEDCCPLAVERIPKNKGDAHPLHRLYFSAISAPLQKEVGKRLIQSPVTAAEST